MNDLFKGLSDKDKRSFNSELGKIANLGVDLELLFAHGLKGCIVISEKFKTTLKNKLMFLDLEFDDYKKIVKELFEREVIKPLFVFAYCKKHYIPKPYISMQVFPTNFFRRSQVSSRQLQRRTGDGELFFFQH